MDDYGSIAARHYAAYRPPLHWQIVRDALADHRFHTALDIGCGVGWSSIALTQVAETVIGVDPSAEMLKNAHAVPRVEYRLGDATNLPVAYGEVDLVSLAGVVPYLEPAPLVDELARVCQPNALILVYDFHVDSSAVLARLSADAPQPISPYAHALNLAADSRLATLQTIAARTRLDVDAAQATHLLLGNERRFRRLAAHFAVGDPAPLIESKLQEQAPTLQLEAKTWFALHQFR